MWALEVLSLAAYYFGHGPYNVGLTFLASLPSTLFLAMFAVTFADGHGYPRALSDRDRLIQESIVPAIRGEGRGDGAPRR